MKKLLIVLTVIFIFSYFYISRDNFFILSESIQKSHRLIREGDTGVLEELEDIFKELATGSLVGSYRLRSFMDNLKKTEDQDLYKEVAIFLKYEILDDNNYRKRQALNAMKDIFAFLNVDLQNEIIQYFIKDYREIIDEINEVSNSQEFDVAFKRERLQELDIQGERILIPLSELIPELDQRDIEKIDENILEDIVFFLIATSTDIDSISPLGNLMFYLPDNIQLKSIERFFEIFWDMEIKIHYYGEEALDEHVNFLTKNLEYFKPRELLYIYQESIEILLSDYQTGHEVGKRILDEVIPCLIENFQHFSPEILKFIYHESREMFLSGDETGLRLARRILFELKSYLQDQDKIIEIDYLLGREN